MKPIRISLSVNSDDPEIIARASETLSRAGSGLALEGIDVFLMWSETEDDEYTYSEEDSSKEEDDGV